MLQVADLRLETSYTPHHNLRAFCCGKRGICTFLRDEARQEEEWHLSRTLCLFHGHNRTPIACVTLAADLFDEFPSVIIHLFAIDRAYQGGRVDTLIGNLSLARYLMILIIIQMIGLNEMGIAVRLLFLHADRDCAGMYTKFGFIQAREVEETATTVPMALDLFPFLEACRSRPTDRGGDSEPHGCFRFAVLRPDSDLNRIARGITYGQALIRPLAVPDQKTGMLGTTLVLWGSNRLGYYTLGTNTLVLPKCRTPNEIPAVTLCDFGMDPTHRQRLVAAVQGTESPERYLIKRIIRHVRKLNDTLVAVRLLLVQARRDALDFWQDLQFRLLDPGIGRNTEFVWLYFDLAGLNQAELA